MPASLLLLHIDVKNGTVVGDCTLAGFEGHIVLDSFRWSIAASTPESLGETRSRVIKPERVTLSKVYDRSSTALANLMKKKPATDPHFLKATLKFLDPRRYRANISAPVEPIMEISLFEGFVEEIEITVSDKGKSAEVKEKVVLDFKKSISISYQEQGVDGRLKVYPEFKYSRPEH